MRRGRCVKCGQATVYASRNGIKSGTTSRTGLLPHIEPGFRGMLQVYETDSWDYACATCGYTERYLIDDAPRQFIAAKWLPVPLSE